MRSGCQLCRCSEILSARSQVQWFTELVATLFQGCKFGNVEGLRCGSNCTTHFSFSPICSETLLLPEKGFLGKNIEKTELWSLLPCDEQQIWLSFMGQSQKSNLDTTFRL